MVSDVMIGASFGFGTGGVGSGGGVTTEGFVDEPEQLTAAAAAPVSSASVSRCGRNVTRRSLSEPNACCVSEIL